MALWRNGRRSRLKICPLVTAVPVRVRPRPYFLLALVFFVLYSPLLAAQFVYDDLWYIVHNPFIREWTPVRFFLDPSTIASPGSGLASDVYRPLMALSLAFDHLLFNLHPTFSHFENLILFGLSGTLVGILAGKLWKSNKAALAAAALFLLHPVQVQTAAWVSQRSNLLCGLAVLLVCWVWCPGRSLTTLRWISGILLAGVACFSRETGVVLPVLYLCLAVASGEEKRSWFPKVMVLALVSIGYLTIRQFLLPHWSQFSEGAISWKEQWALGVMAFPVYLGKLLVPLQLRPSYNYPLITPPPLIFSGIVLAGYIGGMVWVFIKQRRLFLGLAWILAGLLPVLQILPIRAFVAERFLFIPMIGFAITVGGFLAQEKMRRWILALWLVGLASITLQAVPAWKTNASLWKYALKHDPTHAYAHLCYAESINDIPEALAHTVQAYALSRSRELRIASAVNASRLAGMQGDYAQAIVWADQVLQFDPQNPVALQNRQKARSLLKSSLQK